MEQEKDEIEAIVGRDISDDKGKYQVENLPEYIASEVNKIGLDNSLGLLAMLYSRFLTGASIPVLKEYGGNQGWLHGYIE
ncbi:hypothetical protein [Pleionea litopenaei]|uniref:Uncharacterized protein n=1 Tax=Pleionea litopenaei TaxID=3070815 RepID=A0AA51RWK2_9GAMM|nr:hypothetical protein [Pleionea sp. HL-JVS1]WMS88784.1 hypothetical protein Q9312_07660 [Pleionea sp. HL-JVS1]